MDNLQLLYWLGDIEGMYAGQQVKFGFADNYKNYLQRKARHQNRHGKTIKMKLLAGIVSANAPSDERWIKYNYLKKNEWTIESDNSNESHEWVERAPLELRQYLKSLAQHPCIATDEETLQKNLNERVVIDFEDWRPGSANFPVATKKGIELYVPASSDPPIRESWDDVEAPKFSEAKKDGDYYTGQSLIIAAKNTMGGIDLDPASSKYANWGDGKGNLGVRATNYFDVKINGLKQLWYGRIWLNPPFAQWDKWAPKALEEFRSGRVSEMCLLIPARTLTAIALNDLKQTCNAVMIPNGRIPFWGPKAKTPDQGHPIFYFGPNTEKFAKEFSEFGVIFVLYKGI